MGKILPIDISSISENACQVTLVGPVNSGSAYGEYSAWSSAVLTNWASWCMEFTPKGNWSYSSDSKDDTFRLHFWFEDKSDAVVFKLTNENYS